VSRFDAIVNTCTHHRQSATRLRGRQRRGTSQMEIGTCREREGVKGGERDERYVYAATTSGSFTDAFLGFVLKFM